MSQPFEKPRFEIGAMLSSAWGLFTENVGILIGATALVWAIIAVAGGFTWGLAHVVLTGPMLLGYAALILGVARGQHPDFNVLFSGFQRFLPALIANLLISVFCAIGTTLCIIPGIFVMMVYKLTYFYMHDKALDFWPAMEASRKTIMKDFGAWLIVLLVVMGINAAGAMVCGVGLLVTFPVTSLMLALAYEQVKDRPLA